MLSIYLSCTDVRKTPDPPPGSVGAIVGVGEGCTPVGDGVGEGTVPVGLGVGVTLLSSSLAWHFTSP